MVCTFKPNRPRLFHFPTTRKHCNPTITLPLRRETAESNRPSIFFCLPPQEHTLWVVVFVNLLPTPSFHQQVFSGLVLQALSVHTLEVSRLHRDRIQFQGNSGRETASWNFRVFTAIQPLFRKKDSNLDSRFQRAVTYQLVNS